MGIPCTEREDAILGRYVTIPSFITDPILAMTRHSRRSQVENDTVMNFIPIPIPTELKVDKVNIMLIIS